MKFSKAEIPRFRTPAAMTMHPGRRDICPVQHRCENKYSPK
jgi:hypothetical protein